MAIYRFENAVEGSSSRFATDEEFRRASIIVKEDEESPEQAGTVMMDMGNGEIAMGREDLHSFVIGESGCGKTRRIVIPTIDMVSRTREQSMVIADPKGEIFEATAETLRKRGYKVYRFDLTDPSKSQKWNPLSIIARLSVGSSADVTRSRIMLKEILEVLKQGVHSTRDAFWEQSGADLIYGIALSILSEGQPQDLTFRNIDLNMRKIFDNGQLFREYYEKMPDDSPVKNYLSSLSSDSAEQTLCSIKLVAKTMMSPFCSDDRILSLFDTDTMDMTVLGNSNVALFLILSDSSKAMYPVATVFIQQLYSLLLEEAASQKKMKLRVPVFFILDEFANFSRLPDVDSMLTAARSRNIRFMLVCQSMKQLHEKYGENTAEILMSNCRIWIYMNSRDIGFLNRLSQIMGTAYGRFTGREHPLITVSELQHLDEGEVIVLNDRCHPMRGYLNDYTEYCHIEDETHFRAVNQEQQETGAILTLDLMEIWKKKYGSEPEPSNNTEVTGCDDEYEDLDEKDRYSQEMYQLELERMNAEGLWASQEPADTDDSISF